MLTVIILLGMIIRSSLLTHNLPVAWHVDERFLLRVLERLEKQNTLDPNFFQYPSLYLYLNHFLLSPFLELKDYLFGGRVLNLVSAAFLSCTVFALSKEMFGSVLAGILAAAATIYSPTMILSASYLSTDTLLSLFCVASVLFLIRFFRGGHTRDWFVGIVFLGLAIASKYSAASLLISYMIYELIQPCMPKSEGDSGWARKIIDASVPRNVMIASLLLVFVSLLTVYALFPWEQLLALAGSSGDFNSLIDDSDKTFLTSIRSKFLVLALIVGCIAVANLMSSSFSRRACRVRPLLGAGISVMVLFATSPYMLISWKKCAYDFGALMKNSAGGSQSQWLPYFQRYIAMESILLMVFFGIGLCIAWRQKKNVGFPLLYLIISYLIIGGAGSGFPRYLAPLLPVFMAISTWGLVSSCSFAADKLNSRSLQLVFVSAFVLLIGLELGPKIQQRLRLPRNEMRVSYDYVLNNRPTNVFYAAYAPDVELRTAGFHVVQIPSAKLVEGDVSFFEQMLPTDILILSGEQVKRLSPLVLEKLELREMAVKNQDNQKDRDSQKDRDILSDQYIFCRRSGK